MVEATSCAVPTESVWHDGGGAGERERQIGDSEAAQRAGSIPRNIGASGSFVGRRGVKRAGHAACIVIARAWSSPAQPSIDSVDALRSRRRCGPRSAIG